MMKTGDLLALLHDMEEDVDEEELMQSGNLTASLAASAALLERNQATPCMWQVIMVSSALTRGRSRGVAENMGEGSGLHCRAPLLGLPGEVKLVINALELGDVRSPKQFHLQPLKRLTRDKARQYLRAWDQIIRDEKTRERVQAWTDELPIVVWMKGVALVSAQPSASSSMTAPSHRAAWQRQWWSAGWW